MRRCGSNWIFVLVAVCSAAAAAAAIVLQNLQPFADPTGAVATYNVNGNIDESGPFFQSLGTNGRSCGSCHRADQAMSLRGAGVRQIYEQTHGQDPLFQTIDGANCPTDDGRRISSHSLLLEKGLIRIGLTLPQNPEFTLSVVHDPYGCAITQDANTGDEVVSVYRRPLPTTNLRFLSTIMFDGRDTIAALTNATTFPANLEADLTQQALEAIQIHAQAAAAPTADQLNAIVNFELGLSTAQAYSNKAGSLQGYGAKGGPLAVASLQYYPGINDSLGADPAGTPFQSSAMSLFDAWSDTPTGWSIGEDRSHISEEEREDVAAGEKLFNTAVATITDVRGLNDNASLGSPAVIKGTCTTCHDTPNVGNHSFPLPLDIATSRQRHFESNPNIIAGLAKLSPPDLPVYEIRRCPDTLHPGSTTVYYTSDPGKALVSGKCSDVNRGKGPILRGLAARAPYFHNGAAENLQQLVDFYNERFQMNFTQEEKRQLIAFLNSL
jgi:cytochrome c peroxidase